MAFSLLCKTACFHNTNQLVQLTHLSKNKCNSQVSHSGISSTTARLGGNCSSQPVSFPCEGRETLQLLLYNRVRQVWTNKKKILVARFDADTDAAKVYKANDETKYIYRYKIKANIKIDVLVEIIAKDNLFHI